MRGLALAAGNGLAKDRRRAKGQSAVPLGLASLRVAAPEPLKGTTKPPEVTGRPWGHLRPSMRPILGNGQGSGPSISEPVMGPVCGAGVALPSQNDGELGGPLWPAASGP